MTHRRILIIANDPGSGRYLQHALRRMGYEVRLAGSPRDVAAIAGWLPDEIIVDLDGWDGEGLEVCRQIASTPVFGKVPLLAASAFESIADRCAALAAGALDLIGNPPDLLELEFKLVAHGRIFQKRRDERLRFGDLVLDRHLRTVTLPDREVRLTECECKLLAHLIDLGGRVAGVESVLVEVFGHLPRCGDPESVRDKIRNLRKKLEHDPRCPTRILTVSGIGYYLKLHECEGGEIRVGSRRLAGLEA